MPLKHAGERLLLLSLSVEDALKRQSWSELNAVLDAREREIARCESRGIRIDASMGARLSEVDERILSLIAAAKETTGRQLAGLQSARTATKAYKPVQASGAFESVG